MAGRATFEQDRSHTPLAKRLEQPVQVQAAAMAEANGIGEPFRLLLDVGKRHGLPLRPYRVKVMVTPPTNRNRMLYTLDAQARDDRLPPLHLSGRFRRGA
jgi:hypothetical protein